MMMPPPHLEKARVAASCFLGIAILSSCESLVRKDPPLPIYAAALIAPYAFLGPRWDGRMVQAFSAPRTRRLMRARWLAAPFGSSLYADKPLKSLVKGIVTEELLRAIANETAGGRRNHGTPLVRPWNDVGPAGQ